MLYIGIWLSGVWALFHNLSQIILVFGLIKTQQGALHLSFSLLFSMISFSGMIVNWQNNQKINDFDKNKEKPKLEMIIFFNSIHF